MVVEGLQYHQYAVRTDGSGRLTTRNRRYLRRFNPFTTSPNPFTITRQPTRSTTPTPVNTQDRQPTPTQPPTSTATTPPIAGLESQTIIILDHCHVQQAPPHPQQTGATTTPSFGSTKDPTPTDLCIGGQNTSQTHSTATTQPSPPTKPPGSHSRNHAGAKRGPKPVDRLGYKQRN